MSHIQDHHFTTTLGLTKSTSTHGTVAYHTGLTTANNKSPILVLLHGYPNSAYLWRHVIPLLPPAPLFIPDLPGYGNSAAAPRHDKVTVGLRVLSALSELLTSNATSKSSGEDQAAEEAQPVVLIGHDRGARVAHHLHISAPHGLVAGFKIRGLALLDIVPTLSQWEIGDSAASARGWFHWSFLANSELATRMIVAYGGDKWALDMIERWAGSNEVGLAKMRDGEAREVYGEFFKRESVVRASSGDYEAGAGADVEFEQKALEEGRRIEVPLLLVYSGGFLPKRARKPIREVWGRPWSAGEHVITECALGDGVGHFVSEEAPEETAKAIGEWLGKLSR